MAKFLMPPSIFIGKDALSEAKPILAKYGSSALIVTGKHIARSPMMEKLIKALEEVKVTYIVFDGITGEPTDLMIEEGAALYRKHHCEFCIGIGGGSPLDSAKAIAVRGVYDKAITAYAGEEITGEIPPIVAIPTTAGTGSEVTKFTVITDSKSDTKMLLYGSALLPRTAIVAPEFTLDMPKSVTAATGIDALTHAIEAYTSKKANHLTDPYAVSAVKKIMTYLPIAYQNGYDLKAREEMSVAALEAGVCINNSSVTLVHGMSRPIGALFHVPHGMSNAMLLKECLTFALDGTYERFADLSRSIGAADALEGDEEAAKKFLEKIDQIVKLCEIPTLKEYGIGKDQFYQAIDKMASDAVASGSPSNTRKLVTSDDCISIYKKVYGE